MEIDKASIMHRLKLVLSDKRQDEYSIISKSLLREVIELIEKSKP